MDFVQQNYKAHMNDVSSRVMELVHTGAWFEELAYLHDNRGDVCA